LAFGPSTGLRAEFRAMLARPACRKEQAMPTHSPPYLKHSKQLAQSSVFKFRFKIFKKVTGSEITDPRHQNSQVTRSEFTSIRLIALKFTTHKSQVKNTRTMHKNLKDNSVMCNAASIKTFLAKTHPCEKP
jgi:hypothetical protein